VNLLKKYELVFIIKPMEEEATQAVIAKFEAMVTNNGGAMEKSTAGQAPFGVSGERFRRWLLLHLPLHRQTRNSG